MQREFKIGDKVTWDTVSGPKVGSIESEWNGWYIIRLENKKAIVADLSSLRLWNENST